MSELSEPLVRSEDTSAAAMLLRLRFGHRVFESEESEEGKEEDLSELFERHVALTLESSQNPTELCTAAPRFARALPFYVARPMMAAVFPVWIVSCIGPKGLGPPQRLAGFVAVLSLPLFIWMQWIVIAWPPAYGACLREAARLRIASRSRNEEKEENSDESLLPCGQLAQGEEEEEESSSETNSFPQRRRVEMMALSSENEMKEDLASPRLSMTPIKKSKEAAGSRILRIAGCLVPLVATAAFIIGILLYANDATRLDCRIHYLEYYDDTLPTNNSSFTRRLDYDRVHYPWKCSYASAAWLCIRLAGLIVTPVLFLFLAIAIAHYQALRAALSNSQLRQRRVSTSEEDKENEEAEEIQRLLDDANLLFRPAYLIILFSLFFIEVFSSINIIVSRLRNLNGFMLFLLGGSALLFTLLLVAAASLNSLARDTLRRLNDLYYDHLSTPSSSGKKKKSIPVFLYPAFRFYYLPIFLVPPHLLAVSALAFATFIF